MYGNIMQSENNANLMSWDQMIFVTQSWPLKRREKFVVDESKLLFFFFIKKKEKRK